MGKSRILAFTIGFLTLWSAAAFAQAADEKGQPAAEEKQANKEQIGSMVMQMMGSMQKQMVATNDGGVIVLAGNKLLKYDKDLNLVKEAEVRTQIELRMDNGSIQEMMKSMKEKYGKKKE